VNCVERIKWVLAILKTADRSGADKDEPEGLRTIEITDTLANEMVAALENCLAALKRFRVT